MGNFVEHRMERANQEELHCCRAKKIYYFPNSTANILKISNNSIPLSLVVVSGLDARSKHWVLKFDYTLIVGRLISRVNC